MPEIRFLSIAAGLALLSSAAFAQMPADMTKGMGEAKSMADASVCVPGGLVEARSEGAWYPAVVLDPLRDGRCFVHYEGYGSDDDEAMARNDIRSRR